METLSEFRQWWERDFLRRERNLAVVVTIAFAIWVTWLGGREVVESWLRGTRAALYPAVVSACGSLVGFVITAMSVILSWADKEKFVALRRRSGYRQLWPVFGSTVRWLGVSTLVSVAALLFDQDGKDCPAVWFAAALSVLVASLRLARCVWVLEKLITIFAPPEKAPDPPAVAPATAAP